MLAKGRAMSDTTARDNYLPSRRGTGCKGCDVWVPERLNLDEFMLMPHESACPVLVIVAEIEQKEAAE